MASSEARLRLIVEATAQGGAFSSLVSQAETAAREINQALNGAMGGTNANGGVGGGAYGPLIPDSALRGLTNMREQVSLTRKELEAFATGEAKRLGLAMGKDIADPTKVATSDLAKFYEEMNGVKVKVDEIDPHMKRMEQMFALQSIQQASEALKRFGEELAKILSEGVQRAAEAESIGVNLKNALTINKDGSILDENNAVSVEKLNSVMGSLVSTAEQIGLKTMFSDVQIMQVMEHLAANGINAETILNGGAKAVAYLAQATKTELQPTVETVTAIMHGMGKTLTNDFGNDTNKALMAVADTLLNIKLTTGESLQNIGNTMKYVGPIADELGISFNDLGVAVDILARAGIRGSQAGTALRRMFTNLSPVSDKAEEAMRDLGIITADGTNKFYDQYGNVKSLAEIQGVLYESMKDLNDEQKTFALRTIFGQYAMQSMAKLASTTPEDFAILADKISQTGTAMSVGAEQMNTFSGQWDVFIENVNIAKKQLGEALLPILTPIITKLGELGAWFSNLSPEVHKTVAVIAGVVAVLAIVIGTIGSVVASIGLFTIGLEAAGFTLAGVAAAGGLVVAAIAAVIAIGYALYQAYVTNFGGFRDLVDEVWLNYVKPALIDAATAIRDALVGAVQAIKAWWDEMAPSVEKAVANIVAAINYMEPVWSSFWNGFKGVVSGAWTIITSVIEGAWKSISGLFDFFVHLLAGDWDKLWGDIQRMFDGFKTMFLGVFEGAWKAVSSVFASYWNAGSGLISKIFGGGLDDIDQQHSTWKDRFKSNWDTAWGVVRGSFLTSKQLLTGDWEGALNTFTSMVGVKKEALVAAVNDLLRSIGELFTKLVEDAKAWGANLVKMFIDGLAENFPNLTKALEGIGKAIKSYLGFHSPTELGPASDSDTWMPNMMSMFTDGILAGIPELQNAATSAAQAIADPLGKLDLSDASSVDKYARLILDKGDALRDLDNTYKPQIDELARKIVDDDTLTNAERAALVKQHNALKAEYDEKRKATEASYNEQIDVMKNGTTALTNVNASATATNTTITKNGAAAVVNAFTLMSQTIAGQAQNLAQLVKLAWNDMWTTLTTATTQALGIIVAAITAGTTQIMNALGVMAQALKAMFTQLANDARTWGANLGEMFADGLRSKLAEVEAVAKQIAEVVNSYVGFHSPAERGPGADADTWAPNFMRMFTDGIVGARPALQAALNGVAMDMNVAVGGGYAGVAPVAGGRGQTIVYATFVYQGGGRNSDFERFADVVVTKLGSVGV